MNSRIECSNCEAACCQDITLPLSRKGFTILAQAGTELIPIGPHPQDGRLVNFRMVGRCGLLDSETNLCTAYHAERPDVCEQFKTGSPGCIEVRLARGISTKLDVISEGPDGVAGIDPATWQHLNDFETPIIDYTSD